MDQGEFICYIQPFGSQELNFVLDFLDDGSPHQRRDGIFGYGNSQIIEMGPIMDQFDLQNLIDIPNSFGIVVPSINPIFAKISLVS